MHRHKPPEAGAADRASPNTDSWVLPLNMQASLLGLVYLGIPPSFDILSAAIPVTTCSADTIALHTIARGGRPRLEMQPRLTSPSTCILYAGVPRMVDPNNRPLLHTVLVQRSSSRWDSFF